ncbi:hypothetical protein GCG54_00003841, partial [Colletotrichum gloeosporioides]
FLIRKKDRKIRLINSATQINRVTLQNAALPPAGDKFSEDFAIYQLLSLLNFFLRYN